MGKKFKYIVLAYAFPEVARGVGEQPGMEQIERHLEAGWIPVRESPMGGCMVPGSQQAGMAWRFASLVLLEKEVPDKTN